MIMAKLKKKLNAWHIKWRVAKIKRGGAMIGEQLKIYGKIHIHSSLQNLQIGNNCTLNDGVRLGLRGGIKIGNNVRISPDAILISSGLNISQNPRTHFEKSIVLGNNVWIASAAIVSAGVTIGDNSVVGAGSVVTKNIPPNSFWAGVPAKFVKALGDN